MDNFVGWKVWLVSVTGFVFVSAGASGGDPVFDCLGLGGDCCAAQDTPGCDNPLCCKMVCQQDAFCCEVEWDATCVLRADSSCGLLCTGCPGVGGCCVEHVSAGCGDEACCSAVCRHLPWCCILGWDQSCADAAREICPEKCGCHRFADFDGDDSIDLYDVARFQNCFSESDVPVHERCACGDFDGDSDVDLADYGELAHSVTGP